MRDEGDVEPPPTLTLDGLAQEAGTSAAYVDRLVAVGAITPDDQGRFARTEVPRVRLTLALADGGIDVDDLMSVIRSGVLDLDWVSRLSTFTELSGRTFDEFAATMGEHAALLPAIYAALGLAPPLAETAMRRDEEQVLGDFIELWNLVDDRPEVYLRAARIAGDGVRRIQAATQDLFDELGGPPNMQIAKGKSPTEAIRPSLRLSPLLSELLVWLQVRHQEHEIFGRVVSYVEDSLIKAGRGERHGEQPAIAFVDLTGYTELTAADGDQRVAQFASVLQTLAATSARAHRGQVVKLLGDGVMLRYPSLLEAIGSVRELMSSIDAAGLPPAHAGVASGPMVVRDGDVYGATVNLAARIAAQAAGGELLVAADGVDASIEALVALDEAGSPVLKGIANPVRLQRVRLG